jgi:hypothetical protein
LIAPCRVEWPIPRPGLTGNSVHESSHPSSEEAARLQPLFPEAYKRRPGIQSALGEKPLLYVVSKPAIALLSLLCVSPVRFEAGMDY